MKKALPSVLVGAFLMLAAAFFVSAATDSASTVSFPVSELGNCSSKADCHNYCAQTDHMSVCADFAQAHGLQSKQQADEGKKFAQLLQGGGGPGGCQTPGECQVFCSNLKNLNTCLTFAKSNGFDASDPNIQQGEKIQAYLQSGGQMPGGCDSQDSCQNYCSNFAHLQECMSFMKAAGVQPQQSQGNQQQDNQQGDQQQQQLTLDQLNTLSNLVAGGQTPQGCDSQQSCEQVCGGDPANNPNHSECLKFGEALGLITADQAQQFMQSPNGPGGCNSSSTCEQYCNNASHQQECLQFAKDHGFINDQDSQNIQNAAVLGRTDLLGQAPPEVLHCITAMVGQQAIDQIKSGQLPNPDDAEKMRTCFQQNHQSENPQQFFGHLPDQVVSCIVAKVGQENVDAMKNGAMPSSDQIEAVKSCTQTQMPLSSPSGSDNQQQSIGDIANHNPDFAQCVRQQLGSQADSVLQSNEAPDDAVAQKIQICFSMLHPQFSPQQGSHPEGSAMPLPPSPGAACPPDRPDCTPFPPSPSNGGNDCIASNGTPTANGCLMPGASPLAPPPSQLSPSPNKNGTELPPPTSALYIGIQGLLKVIGL